MNRRAMIHHRRSIFVLSAALILAACNPAPGPGPLDGATIGGEFSLVDSTGKTVKYSDFAGKYRIVYFGYASCPDVCPIDMANLMGGYRLFARDHGDEAKRIQPLFITVDPQRDTPQVVGQYARAFGPEVIGLTGTPEAIAAAEKAFVVYASKVETGDPRNYKMDHTRAAYLMGPDGKPIALLPAEQNARAVAEELAKWVR